MKLRSGKILDYSLPIELKEELQIRLERFKELFSANLKHAKELLYMISHTIIIDERFQIIDNIMNEYGNSPAVFPRLAESAGALLLLITGKSDFYKDHHIEPNYHKLIKNTMEHFDLDSPVLGDIGENYES